MVEEQTKEIKVLDKGFVRLVDHMGTDFSIVQAARVSYGKGTKKVSEDEGLIRYLLRHQHTTPFEMVQFKFHIKAPLFVFRQWHRHRTWSFNEYSGRYSEMKDEFYIPEDSRITKQSVTNKQGSSSEVLTFEEYKEFYNNKDAPPGEKLSFINTAVSQEFEAEQKTIREWYEDKVAMNMSKELARINLPLSQYSEMYASVDLHNLLHFLRLRLDSHAQIEIRVYAEAIYGLIKPIVPICCQAFEDYVLNSKKFSGLEWKTLTAALRESLTEDQVSSLIISLQKSADSTITNKRENSEFISKIKELLKIDV